MSDFAYGWLLGVATYFAFDILRIVRTAIGQRVQFTGGPKDGRSLHVPHGCDEVEWHDDEGDYLYRRVGKREFKYAQ